jgi:FAD/FMN-containing dehydrogenase
VLHEGRIRNGRWCDWAKANCFRPGQYAAPSTMEEIARIVRESGRLRVVGGGHSFNDAMATEDTLLTLDNYAQLMSVAQIPNGNSAIAHVQTGMRLRDFTRQLKEKGYAVSVAGSTDAQSIGGLIATDVHGTGRDHGFLSESIRSLRIVDARGNVNWFERGSDVFHGAIGGAGMCGVVIEAKIEVEPAYNLAKAVKVVCRTWAENNIDALLRENHHLSFYYFGGFARRNEDETGCLLNVRMNKWNRTVDPPTTMRKLVTMQSELGDLLFSGFLFDIARMLHVLSPFIRIGMWLYGFTVNHREVVYPAADGFPRTLYFRHDEIEYGIPFDEYQECLREVRELLIAEKYPSIIEVRFTPDKTEALLGPGVGRRTVFIELAPGMSAGSDVLFSKFEKIMLKYKGQAHMGKKTYLNNEQFARMYPRETLVKFLAAARTQDPDGKFRNAWTDRLFGSMELDEKRNLPDRKVE